MKIKVLRTIALAAFLICQSANIFGQTAAETPLESALFGMHNLSAGQTARLSVVIRKPISDSEIIPCVRAKVVFDVYEIPPPDAVRPRFVRRIEREELLETGEAAQFNFPAAASGNLINASVFVYRGDEKEPVRGAATSTLQIVESGRTILTLPGIIKGFDPQPDPPR